MDDATSMSLEGTLMALAHSLYQFSPTSPTKYCFCPRVFGLLQVLDEGRLERRTFLPEK